MLAAGAAALSPGLSSAQETEPAVEKLGVFKDWIAQSYKEKGRQVCTMWSKPAESEGNYTKRGEVYVFVTHRPALNRADEISVNIGYIFKTGAPVKVKIGGANFELFSQGGTAWTRTSKEDRVLMRAMRAGAKMTVEGISRHGTRTLDSFSLSGFSAAYNAITRACKVR